MRHKTKVSSAQLKTKLKSAHNFKIKYKYDNKDIFTGLYIPKYFNLRLEAQHLQLKRFLWLTIMV